MKRGEYTSPLDNTRVQRKYSIDVEKGYEDIPPHGKASGR
jgi:hypothetical protein